MIIKFLFLAVAVTVLTSCLSSGNNNPNDADGSVFPLQYQEEQQVLKVDEQNKYLVLKEVDTWCDDSVLHREDYVDTTFYDIKEGALYLWGNRTDCKAERYRGGSSSVLGQWALTSFTDHRSYTPAPEADLIECEEDKKEETKYTLPLVTGATGSLIITNENYNFNVQFDYCLAVEKYDDFIEYAQYSFNTSDTSAKIIEKSCTNFEVVNNGKKASVNFSQITPSVARHTKNYTMTFTYNNTVCSYVHVDRNKRDPQSNADCKSQDNLDSLRYSAWNIFEECVQKTDFYTQNGSNQYLQKKLNKLGRQKRTPRFLRE